MLKQEAGQDTLEREARLAREAQKSVKRAPQRTNPCASASASAVPEIQRQAGRLQKHNTEYDVQCNKSNQDKRNDEW